MCCNPNLIWSASLFLVQSNNSCYLLGVKYNVIIHSYISCITCHILYVTFHIYSGLSLSRLLSISNFSLSSNKKLGPLDIYALCKLILSLLSRTSLSRIFLYLEQKSWSLATISLSISNFFPSKSAFTLSRLGAFTQQREQKCLILENRM